MEKINIKKNNNDLVKDNLLKKLSSLNTQKIFEKYNKKCPVNIDNYINIMVLNTHIANKIK